MKISAWLIQILFCADQIQSIFQSEKKKSETVSEI